MGITLATYRAWCNDPRADVTELRTLSRSTATSIYGSDYWNRLRGSALPAGLDLLVFDFAVTCGTVRSARELQAALGLPAAEIDGSVGPETLLKAGLSHGMDLITRLTWRQTLFYRALPTFSVFGTGWLARTERRRVKALAMAGTTPRVTAQFSNEAANFQTRYVLRMVDTPRTNTAFGLPSPLLVSAYYRRGKAVLRGGRRSSHRRALPCHHAGRRGGAPRA